MLSEPLKHRFVVAVLPPDVLLLPPGVSTPSTVCAAAWRLHLPPIMECGHLADYIGSIGAVHEKCVREHGWNPSGRDRGRYIDYEATIAREQQYLVQVTRGEQGAD